MRAGWARAVLALVAALLLAPAAWAQDLDPPTIAVLESGAPLPDGEIFARAVTPVIQVADASTFTVAATLDGAAYTSGTAVTAEGQHELLVTATDAGNHVASLALSFEIDQTPPAFLSLSPAAESVLATASVTLAGTLDGAATLEVDGAAVAIVGGAFSAGPYNLVEGPRDFSLVATDAAGNSVTRTHRVVRDAMAPALAITSPAAGAVVGESPLEIAGTASDLHALTVAVNGVTATRSGNNWTARVPLAEGTNQATARATDAAGNSSEARRALVLDSAVPVVAITSPAAGTIVPGATLEVRGQASDAHLAEVKVNGAVATVSGGLFRATVALAAGTNTLQAVAKDSLGHQASASVEVQRDELAAAIAITAPEDGAYLTAAEIEVAGEVGEGLAVTVNGQAATVAAGHFSLAGVALGEGENRLLARASGGAGGQGTHSILVYRDTVAPEILAAQPADGAAGIPASSVFEVTFSENVALSPASAWRLETAAGTPIAASGGFSGDTLAVRPDASLPSQAQIRLIVGAAVADRAGNPLAAARTFTFTTRDDAAPAAPTLQPAPPAAICAARLELHGTTEALAALEVTGGAAAAGAQADAAGVFTLSVPLLPGVRNRLELTARDAEGNVSPPRLVDLSHDCRPPSVLGAELQNGGFEVSFDEPLAPASLSAGAIRVVATAGPLAGSLNLSAGGDRVVFTPSEALPAGALRLDVTTAVRDRAGNALAFPYSQVFGGDEGNSFVAGRVIDAATGRPLAGARVLVVASDGVANPAPEPQETTGADGRFSIALPAGSHFLLMTRPGYTPAFRYEQALPGVGADLIDPRLTPAATPVTLGPAGGGFPALGPAQLEIPANALAAATPVAVTGLEEQALPALLPFGWSPRGAVWLDLGGASLAAPATLRLPADLPAGVTAPVVRLDPVTLQWRVVALAAVENGAVTALAPGDGAYAVVWGDPEPLAPPPAVAGAVLGSAAAPDGAALLEAALAFDPELVLPSQRSEVKATYQVTAPVASGLPLTLRIREELTLLDGSVRHQPTYEADLILYHDAAGAPSSHFGLKPSAEARQTPIQLGAEDVVLRRYLGATVRGNVLGPAGGEVSTPEGDRVMVAAGGLAVPTPVVLVRKAEEDLPFAMPAGLVFAGLLDLDLGGQTLASPARLELELGQAPAAGQALVFGYEERGGQSFLRPLAQLEATASGYRTAAIDPADLPWPGVVHGGLLLFARSAAPLAFARGTVFGLAGQPLAGAWVKALGHPWIQVAASDGRYALPLRLGATTVAAEDLATLDVGGASAAPVTAGQRLELDLHIAASGPRILATNPADGAQAVTLGIEPTVSFSEAVDPVSLATGIQLFDGDALVAASVELQGGTQARLVPDATLRPGHGYELRVSALVRDLSGRRLEAGGSFRFTTVALPVYDDIDLTHIHLFEPDVQGRARILGRPGAAPAGALVFVENLSRFAATPSVTAAGDGSFELWVEARLSDVLLLHVAPTGRNETVIELTPFLTADGKGAYADRGETAFTTLEGIEVRIAAGTFDRPTVVRLKTVPTSAIRARRPADFDLLYAFDLDTGGVLAHKALQLRIPVAAPDSFPIFLGRELSLAGEWYWTCAGLLRADGSALTTEDEPEQLAQALPPWMPRPVARLASTSPAAMLELAVGAAALGQGQQHPFRKSEYLPGAANPGRYMLVAAKQEMDYLLMPLAFLGGFSGVLLETAMEGLATTFELQMIYLLPHDALLVPTRRGQQVTLTGRDPFGLRVFEQTFALPPPGEILILPPDAFGDHTPPWPISGTPLRFLQLVVPASSGTRDLDHHIRQTATVESNGYGTLYIEGEARAVDRDVKVQILGLDDEAHVEVRSAADGSFSLSLPVQRGHHYLLAAGARILPQQALSIGFSEELAADHPGISVLDGADPLEVRFDLTETRAQARILPPTVWQAGRTYTLRLDQQLKDAAGNSWERRLEIPFEVAGSETGETFPLDEARDFARLGSLIFVAAGEDGLAVLDGSDPMHLKSLLGTAEAPVYFPFAMHDPVNAVAVDPHGRVYVAGGGVHGFGQLKIFDPTKLVPAVITAIAANPDDPAYRDALFRGSTIVSDRLGGGGISLPEGRPRRVAIHSEDLTARFQIGEPPPPGLTVSYSAQPTPGADVLATFSGENGVPGHPVTVRDLSLGRFKRTDVDPSGAYSIQLKVRKGDRVEVLRNRLTLAYVAISGVGVQVVSIDDFYDEDPATSEEWVPSDVIGTYSGYGDSSLRLCNQPVSDIGAAMLDLGLLGRDQEGGHPLSVVALIGFRGLALFDSPLDGGLLRNPANLIFYNEACLDIDGSPHVAALEIAESYPFDLNGNGFFEEDEYRDYLLVAHRDRGIFVFDAKNREDLKLVERMPMPGVVAELTLDPERRLLYVSGSGSGLHVLDFDHAPLAEPDADGDGKSDRLIETIALPGNTNSPTLVVPQLGIAYAGGLGRGVTSIAVTSPQLAAMGDAEIPEGADPFEYPRWQALAEIWPFGLAAPEPGENRRTRPGFFHLLAALPGVVGDEIRIDLESLGPTGAPMVPAGDPEDHPELPRTRLDGAEHGVTLARLAENRWEEGYQLFLSKRVEAIADLRAARGYQRTPEEDERCQRCPDPEEGEEDGEPARQILSGNQIAIRYPEALRTQLGVLYPLHQLDQAEVRLNSIPWDISPALEQEPQSSASDGGGAAVPGTLLHSGELTQDATDLALRGPTLDLKFERTYRSQTLGNGPLGPGWDFVYRQRLRKLPTGDVEYFDGSGRREIFKWNEESGYRSPPGRLMQLVRTSAGWVIIDAQHNLIRFDHFGRLTAMADWIKDDQSDESGTQLEFEYDTRSRLVRIEAHGREILLDYSDDGRLEHVRDFRGRELDYEYDAAGRLVGVKTPRVTTGLANGAQRLETRYDYEPAFGGTLATYLRQRDNLTGITDAKGQKTLEFTYGDGDQDGYADEVTAESWGGHPVSIHYDFGQKSAAVTDRRGKTWTFVHDEAGHARQITGPTGATIERSYAESGLMTSEKLPGGRRVVNQEPTELDDPRKLGNVRQAKVIPGDGGANGSSPELITVFGDYNGRTNATQTVTDPRGNVTRNVLNDVGLPTELVQADGTVVRTEYNKVGQPTKVTDPAGNVKTYTYFTELPRRGFLEKTTVDPGGLALATRYEVDDLGNVTAEIDPRGARTEYVYNELGWLVEERAPLGLRQRFLYDENGKVVEETLSAGETGSTEFATRYEYGSLGETRKVRREIGGGGGELVETFSYDANLNLTEQVAADGRIDRTTYDDRNLPVTHQRGADTALEQTETYRYDADGNLVERIDALGRSWKSFYDGYGRLKESLDPLGGKIATTYDDNNLPLQVRRFDPAGQLVAFEERHYDLLNRLDRSVENAWELDPAGGAAGNDPPSGSRALTSVLHYDAASNLTEKIDPRGVAERFEFDKANRLRVEKLADGSERTFHYDAAGNIVRTELIERGPDGGAIASEERRVFDDLGRATEMTDAAGNVTRAVYDVRGNLLRSIDAEGNVTSSTYDGLDRPTLKEAPEGIHTAITYDAGSRVTALTDALGHTSSWAYDVLGRPTSTTFADGNTYRVLAYDAGDRPVRTQDAMGTEVVGTFDLLDRVTHRAILPGEGVVGPVAETFQYDGLGDLIRTTSGEILTTRRFDSLGRLVAETSAGRTVAYQLDDSGNVTQLQYPSGRVARFEIDGANRLKEVAWQVGGDAARKALFRYRGPQVAEKVVGAALSGLTSFDAGRRPLGTVFRDAADRQFFAEAVEWSPRNLRRTITRGDRNGIGYAASYDSAGRLVFARAIHQDGAEPEDAAVAGLPDSFAYTFDAAQNLLSMRQDEACDDDAKALPLDGSGRNRPAAIGEVPLAWDANGNLKRKGGRYFAYDFRNRLTRVTDAQGVELAAYDYDTLNRRLAKRVGGHLEETVWADWRPLEIYRDQVLESRRTYGAELDEVVAIEQDLDGAPGLEQEYVPVYDAVGNLAMLTDPAGEPIERYSYSPFGDRYIEIDDAPPAWQQLRVVGEELWLEASEEVDLASLKAAAAEGELKLRNLTQDAEAQLRLNQPVQEGRQARHRVVLSATGGPASAWPQPGDQVELVVPAGALRDLFGQVGAASLSRSFSWPAAAPAPEALFDGAAPAVLQVCTTADHRLEIQLSEPPDPARLASVIAVDGAATEWSPGPDLYTWRSAPLEEGTHQLSLAATPLDFAGQGLAAAFALEIEVGSAAASKTHFSAPLNGFAASSTVANPLGWHGFSYDEETGFYYVRNRYYDPAMGRFTTVDPMLFVDGPNPYQFGANSPLTFDDPTGESIERKAGQLAEAVVDEVSALTKKAGSLGRGLAVDAAQAEALALAKKAGKRTGRATAKAAGKVSEEAAELVAKATGEAVEAAEKAAQKAIGKSGRRAAATPQEVVSKLPDGEKLVEDYATLVKSNKPWSWEADFPGARLTTRQRKSIKAVAVERGLIPDVKLTTGYADFKAAGQVLKEVELPPELWLKSDAKQFSWLDRQIGGKQLGTTWHHTETPGVMQLVPFGIHNVNNHRGGRSMGHWSHARR